MAQRVVTNLVSDLSGEVLEEGQGETISFGFGKNQYTIDLTNVEADEFRKLIHKYTSVAQSAGRASTTRSSSTSTSSNRRDKGYLASVRNWAALKGIQVSARGRVAESVIQQYEADQSA